MPKFQVTIEVDLDDDEWDADDAETVAEWIDFNLSIGEFADDGGEHWSTLPFHVSECVHEGSKAKCL